MSSNCIELSREDWVKLIHPPEDQIKKAKEYADSIAEHTTIIETETGMIVKTDKIDLSFINRLTNRP